MPLVGTSSSHGMSSRLKPVVSGGTLTYDDTYSIGGGGGKGLVIVRYLKTAV